MFHVGSLGAPCPIPPGDIEGLLLESILELVTRAGCRAWAVEVAARGIPRWRTVVPEFRGFGPGRGKW